MFPRQPHSLVPPCTLSAGVVGLRLCLQTPCPQGHEGPGSGPFIPRWCRVCCLPWLSLEKGSQRCLFPISCCHPTTSPLFGMGQYVEGGWILLGRMS